MKPALAALAATLAAGLSPAVLAGPYDQPYALVERGRVSDPHKEDLVAIQRIDGVSIRDPRTPDPVAPGKRRIQLQYETAKGKFRPDTQEIELDLKPCTRYEITAQYDNPLGPNWKPKIKEEPIGECRAKFFAKK